MSTALSEDVAAHAWLTSMEVMARVLPGGICERAGTGTSLLATGAPFAGLNGAMDVTTNPRAERIRALAKRASEELTMPWSIQVRAEPDAELSAVAAELGLGTTSLHTFMVKELADGGPDYGPAPEELVIRPVGADHSDAYIAALAAGFETPVEMMRRLGSPQILDLSCVVAYLAYVDGAVVGTGLALRTDDCVGVFNISVTPDHRRRGYGRAVAAAALRAEQDRGARTAFLHSSRMGLAVYRSLGFRAAEQWTRFTW
jgi:GNAT superfamily N-acetyltransferase